MDQNRELEEALAECARLRDENRRLRLLLKHSEKRKAIAPIVTGATSRKDRIGLFRSLFGGRRDLYAVRWVNRSGRSGYSPACSNEWDKALCRKPRTKCADCPNRRFLPLTDEVILAHLSGRRTVGVYPLLPDETCRFLAVDFDKSTWFDDAGAYLESCSEAGIPSALERSRSGHGGHVWIFFESPVPAALARKLGCTILTRAMEKRPDITFDSYDRFFPSQDTIPNGGFGNLIALPLQGDARDAGNTVFLDREGEPFDDQWTFLAAIERIGRAKVEAIVSEAQDTGRVLGVRPSLTEFQVEDPWTVPPSGKIAERPITESLPKSVAVVVANMVYVDKTGLPPSAVTRIKRLASFQNPEFYRAQAMRMSTFGKPRVISCAEDVGRYIALPRGSIDELLEMFSAHGIEVSKRDERSSGVPLGVDFTGDLSAEQKKAVAELMKEEIGVLSAATAFGKTVVAAWMIASRGVNTLVLVHRQQLMDQWRDRLTMFLAPRDLGQAPERDFVGAIGGGKDTRTGIIDIGMLQSLNRKGEVRDLVAEYGQIIADECHHIPAFSFERVLKKAKPRYVLGLTATPVRKDGHHPIIVMQCGPIRYRVDSRQEARRRPFEHVVLPRYTNFKLDHENSDARIQDVYRALAEDEERNNMLFDDILESLEAGRTPLVLTERVAHVNSLAERLRGFAKNVVVLKGGLNLKQRKELMKQLQSIPCGEERVIVSTGRYIGEGFDDGRLDTLFLAMPVSWRGTLEQYSGRLHRIHSNKKDVRIYDYVDSNVGVLDRMFKRRIKGYASLGYVVRHAQSPGDL